MRIGIVSDTHDQIGRTARAVSRLMAEGAEALIHCGDVTRPEVVHEFVGLPTYFVLGNNDDDEAGLRRAIQRIGGKFLGVSGEIELGGRRIAVTHGDSYAEMRRLALAEPDYLLFGHTHEVSDEKLGATRWINPGALHRATNWTVALLDLEIDALQTLMIRDRL